MKYFFIIFLILIQCKSHEEKAYEEFLKKMEVQSAKQREREVKDSIENSIEEIRLDSIKQFNESHILKIRKWYGEIENSIKNCTLVYGGCMDPGCEMIGYYNKTKRKIMKVVTTSANDWIETESSVYFKNDSLIFIYSEGYSGKDFYTAEELGATSQQLWQMGGQAKTIEYWQTRLYFKDNKCIKHLEKSVIVNAKHSAPNMAKYDNVESDLEPFNTNEFFDDVYGDLSRLKENLDPNL